MAKFNLVVAKTFCLILSIAFLAVMPLVSDNGVSLTKGILADAMNTIITANSWLPTSDDVNVPHYALVFCCGGPNCYVVAADYGFNTDSVELLHVARMAELDNVSSNTIDSLVCAYLNNVSMLGMFPVTETHDGKPYYSMYDRFSTDAWSYLANTKWNVSAAIAQLEDIVKSNGTSIMYNQNSGWDIYHRYYDDTAETLEWFLQLHDYNMCRWIWNFQQNSFWTGSYYDYDGTVSSGMETEVGGFALISGRYLETVGLLSQFQDRIVSDLNQKLLVNSYSSPLWNHYALNHAPGYDERRLRNTAEAWAAMQAFYPVMPSPMKTTLQGMGTIGWRGLLSDSGLFNSGLERFRLDANASVSTGMTGVGLMIMFMNGIVPVTGSLAVPLNDECYEDTCGWSSASMFNFNYTARQIRIPVNEGQLNFTFGTGTSTYIFPSTGVYIVQFSNDWNTVVSAVLISTLDSRFKYIG